MKFIQIPSAAFLLTTCAFDQTGIDVGVMQGSVFAEDNSPIANATVYYSRMVQLVGSTARPQLAPGDTAVQGQISTDKSGSFAIPSLAGGDYVLCAEVPGAPYLNPCKWFSAPKTNIAASTVGRPVLILKKGVFLQVRVNDPGGFLPPVKNDPSHAPNLIIGVVFGSGAFLAADITRADKTGRDYQMTIPAGVPLKLWAFSRHVTLADANGSVVDNSGGRIPFQAASGVDQVFTLNVTGRDPQSP